MIKLPTKDAMSLLLNGLLKINAELEGSSEGRLHSSKAATAEQLSRVSDEENDSVSVDSLAKLAVYHHSKPENYDSNYKKLVTNGSVVLGNVTLNLLDVLSATQELEYETGFDLS